MKNFIFCALAALAGLVSCNQAPKSYTLSGTINTEKADLTKPVFLLDASNMQKLDSAKIVNKAFTFKGVQDTGKFVYLFVQGKGRRSYVPYASLYLENGSIEVVFDKKATIAGTKINNLLNKHNKTIDSIYTTNPATSPKDFKVKKVALEQEQLKTIKENQKNDLGFFILKNCYSRLSLENLKKVLPLFAEKEKENKSYKAIQTYLTNKEKTAVGKTYTDFTMPNAEGKEISLSDYVGKGKYVLIDFWASWCGPCCHEIPTVVKAYKKYSKDYLEIVGVSFDREKESWLNKTKELNITWPQMSDLNGCKAAKAYNVNSIPHTVLIDKEGKIIAKDLRGEDMLEKFKELFETKK